MNKQLNLTNFLPRKHLIIKELNSRIFQGGVIRT